jgi:AcrR family transcriptional regulator
MGEPAIEILNATSRALCEHGYANLTLQDIAAEADMSTASIHYHYDSKHDLFTAFLDYLYEGYIDRVDAIEGDTHHERLIALVEFSLAEGDDVPGLDFRTAMLEIKAQAPYEDAFRERLTRFDRYLADRIHEVVAAGVEAGEFPDVDPAETAEFIVTTIKGAHTRRVSIDHPLDRIREILIEYVETRLVDDRPGAEVDA